MYNNDEFHQIKYEISDLSGTLKKTNEKNGDVADAVGKNLLVIIFLVFA